MYSGTHIITYIASTCQERLSLLSRFHPCRAPSRAHVREGAAGSEGAKRGKIYLNRALKYIFLFVSKTGCFLLCVIFQGLKTVQKYKIGLDLVRFEFKTAKRAKSIGRASYAEAKKSAERGSKRRIELQKGGWHFVYFT